MKTKEFLTLQKNLLPHLPGFVMSGRLMFIAPLRHMLRGISFDGSDFDKKSFSVSVFVMPLFVPSEHLTLNFADRVRNMGNGDRWNIDMPNLHYELSKALKQSALPFLSSIELLKDFVKMAQESLNQSAGSRSFKNPHTLQSIAYALAYSGDFKKSQDALVQLLQQLDLTVPWQMVMKERADSFQKKLALNSADAQRQLETWEAETTKNLGLESYR